MRVWFPRIHGREVSQFRTLIDGSRDTDCFYLQWTLCSILVIARVSGTVVVLLLAVAAQAQQTTALLH